MAWLRLIEVAVVSISLLFILILGVVMVEKVFSDGKSVAMFHQTSYAYGMFEFTELQLQGKAGVVKGVETPTTTVGAGGTAWVIPATLRFFGVLISDLPDSTKYDGVNVDNAYYGFDDYGGKSVKPENPKWIDYTGLIRSVGGDFTTVVYRRGTLYDLLSPNSYLVTVLPVFRSSTGNFSFYERAFGSYTVTAKVTTYAVKKYGIIPETLYFYPSTDVGIGYVTDVGIGSATLTLFSILRSAYPFNTMNTVEQFFYYPLGTGLNLVVVRSSMDFSVSVKGFYLVDGTLTNGSVVKINGKDYTILTGARSVYGINNGTVEGSFSVEIYYGKLKVEKPAVSPNVRFKQRTTVITVSPFSPDVEPLELFFEPVEVKILTHKKHLIFTVEDGTKYKVVDFKFD